MFQKSSVVTRPVGSSSRYIHKLDAKSYLLDVKHHKASEISKSSNNLVQRVGTGVVLGAGGIVFLYGSKNVFVTGLALISILALREYNNLLNKIGFSPSTTLGVLVALASALTAGFKFKFHSLVIPIACSVLLSKVFIFNSKLPSISEVSSELLGWLYVAFLPSYWILLKFLPPSVMSTICRPQMFDNLDRGFLLAFFSMATIAFSGMHCFF